MNQHPALRSALTNAADMIWTGRNARDDGHKRWADDAFTMAREFLITALAIAKTLQLGAVIARVLLALREVGKASRALTVV
jgi:hypothetical protein